MKKWGRLLMVLLTVMVLGWAIPETAKASEALKKTVTASVRGYTITITLTHECRFCGLTSGLQANGLVINTFEFKNGSIYIKYDLDVWCYECGQPGGNKGAVREESEEFVNQASGKCSIFSCGKSVMDSRGLRYTISIQSTIGARIPHTLTHVEGVSGGNCVSDGNLEYWYCTVCEKYFKDADGTNETTLADVTLAKDPDNHVTADGQSAVSTEWQTDDKNHWLACSLCGVKVVEQPHIVDIEATCAHQAVCGLCEKPYGALNPDNHELTPGGWKTNEDNTEHWRVYACCNKVIQKAAHTGGTATCVDQAVCISCGNSYGALDEDNHSWGEWEWQADGTHTRKCTNGCGAVDECTANRSCSPAPQGTGHYWQCDADHGYRMSCSGGTATCTDKAECVYCGREYGEKDATRHSGKKVWKTDDDNTKHWQEWDCCNVKVAETEGTHTSTGDSVATCTKKAVCDFCKREYGSSDPDHHAATVTRGAKDATCTGDGYTGDTHCKDCGTKLSDGNVIPSTGHSMTHTEAKAATCVDEGNMEYWYCSQCKKYFSDKDGKNEIAAENVKLSVNPDAHDWGDYVSNGDDTHYQVCKNDANHHSEPVNCHGGTATCEAQAVCEDCNTAYGTVLGHNWGDYASNGNGTHSQVCTRDTSHRNTPVECTGGEATCQNKAVCDVCQQPYGDLAPCKDEDSNHYCDYGCGAKLTDHDYTAVVTKPTCLKKGFTTYTCGICGDNYVDDITSATGHWYGLWSLDQQHAHTATCRNAGCTHTAATACTQYEVTVDENGTVATVCPVCGEFGEAIFEVLEDASVKTIDRKPLPKGEAIVRGMEAPFDGVLYAFTVAYEFAGEVQPFEHAVSISLKLDDTLTNFRLVRVDVTPATEDAERTEVWTELEFTLEDGLLTFETEHEGLFLLLPVA